MSYPKRALENVVSLPKDFIHFQSLSVRLYLAPVYFHFFSVTIPSSSLFLYVVLSRSLVYIRTIKSPFMLLTN